MSDLAAMEQFVRYPAWGGVLWKLVVHDDQVYWLHAPTRFFQEAQPKMVVSLHELEAVLQRCKELEEENAAMQERVERFETQKNKKQRTIAEQHAQEANRKLHAELPPAGSICTHHGPGTFYEEEELAGTEITDVESWHHHLNATLFHSNNKKGWSVQARLTQREASRFKITGCKTKSNRFFHIRCRNCDAVCFGQYDKWCSLEEIAQAQNDLLRFLKLQIPAGPATV